MKYILARSLILVILFMLFTSAIAFGLELTSISKESFVPMTDEAYKKADTGDLVYVMIYTGDLANPASVKSHLAFQGLILYKLPGVLRIASIEQGRDYIMNTPYRYVMALGDYKPPDPIIDAIGIGTLKDTMNVLQAQLNILTITLKPILK